MNAATRQQHEPGTRCGQVAIIGRPNVGKSTLLNRLLGRRISIVTHKPQTTRRRLLGILTVPGGQILLLDTPGIHRGGKRAINRYMNRSAQGALAGVDAVVWMLDATRDSDDDAQVLALLREFNGPVLAVLNKVDRVADKARLLPRIEALAQRREFHAILPLSARSGEGVERLPEVLLACMPEAPVRYQADRLTDATDEFLAAELVREQLLRCTHQEVPYSLTVTIERFKRTRAGGLVIGAMIWVEREGQKAVVIGKGGEMLKTVGTRAREAMEQLFRCRVHLELWVKHKANWSDDEQAMRQLGYTDRA